MSSAAVAIGALMVNISFNRGLPTKQVLSFFNLAERWLWINNIFFIFYCSA